MLLTIIWGSENLAKATKKVVSMEETLWKSADKLRGSVEPSEYKHVVLSLIFLRACLVSCRVRICVNCPLSQGDKGES